MPYDPTFPTFQAKVAYHHRWAERLAAEAIREFIGDLTAAMGDILEDLGAVFRTMADGLSHVITSMTAAGALPPDPSGMLHGKRWRSPVTGQQYRVAGRPGNRHWIETGPRGWRRR